MTDSQRQVIQRFGLTYFAIKEGIRSGVLAPQEQLQMVDIMASLFRDFVEMHVMTLEVNAAVEADELINKAKSK
jgi:hypothetical protein